MRTRSRRWSDRLRIALLGLLLAAPLQAEGGLDRAWRERLADAHQVLTSARARSEGARNTYQDWRQRKYPRGTRKEELVREIDEAEKAEAEAEERFAGLLEEARKGGATPGLLREFE